MFNIGLGEMLFIALLALIALGETEQTGRPYDLERRGSLLRHTQESQT